MARQNSTETGQAGIMIALSVGLLFGILGLVTDIGFMYYKQQAAQAAAEAAAMSGANAAKANGTYSCASVGCESSPTSCSDGTITAALTSACQYAQTNGFKPGGNSGRQNVTVQAGVSSAPPTVSSATASYWVTVRVVESVPQLFSYVMGNHTGQIAARATAAVIGGGGGGGCIYVLDPTDSQSFFVSGASLTTACGIMIKSNNSQAMVANGNSTVTATGGAPIDIVGNYQHPSDQSVISPTPTVNYPSVTDPLGSLPAPSFSKAGCDYTNFNQSNITANTTLNPGVYCGGINIGGGTVNFSGGNYILNGGGLTLQGSNTTVTQSAGVMFYSTAYTTTSGYTGSYGPLLVSGQPNVTLSAPSSGTYQGILYYQDRSVAVGSSQSQVNGYSTVSMQGTFYFPTTQLLYTGQSATGYYTGFVVYKLTINGQVNIKQDTDGQHTGLGGSGATVSLIE